MRRGLIFYARYFEQRKAEKISDVHGAVMLGVEDLQVSSKT